MRRETSSGGTRSWSISRRITVWASCCIVGVLVLETAVASWLVRDSLQRELDALIVEEAAELRLGLLENGVDEVETERLVLKLDREHPTARISLRASRSPFAEPWITAGAQPRIAWDSLPEFREGAISAPGPSLRLHTSSLTTRIAEPSGNEREERIQLYLLIDGQPRGQNLNRSATLLLLFSLVVGSASMLAGFIFARRLSTTLQNVAESASLAEREGHESLVAPEGAPTEVRAVVEAFRESLRQLNDRHSRNVLLTAGLGHELRSPLQNLISEAEVGLLSERSARDYRELVERQLDELRKLALVVDNLITLTALRDRRNLPRGEKFDFAAEARNRLGHEDREAARRDVSIEVHEHGDCAFEGDREALMLTLRNLVGNAVRWTAESSTVDVTIDGRDEVLRILVEDHGPGVAEGEAEAIFGAFFRGSAPRGSRAGYGLGLALARMAVRVEGGEITVGKSDSGGASFAVELPREREPGPTV